MPGICTYCFPPVFSSTALGFYWLSFSFISPLPSPLPSLRSGCPQELSGIKFTEQISDFRWASFLEHSTQQYTHCCLLIIVFSKQLFLLLKDLILFLLRTKSSKLLCREKHTSKDNRVNLDVMFLLKII